MADNAIWAVTGPEHDARMARELAWIATGGQTGIVGPESLEVVAQSTPNNTVRIMPGGFSISATSERANIGYTSAPWQSYMRAVYQPMDVEIDTTGSSGGRTDVVGVVVDDPEFEGTSPDVDAHQYWRAHVVKNAGNNATRPEHFASLGRPFLPLAQVRIPSSTATITDSMVHDIRFLAVSRSHTRELIQQASGDLTITIPASQTSWYTVTTFSGVQVPQWATQCEVSFTLGPVYGLDDGVNGQFRVRTSGQEGSVSTPSSLFVETSVSPSERFYMHAAGTINIGRPTMGGESSFELQVRRTNTSVRTGRLIIPSNDSQICMATGRVTYEESRRRS